MIFRILSLAAMLLSDEALSQSSAASVSGSVDIYVAALRFFTPARNQVRWLDSRLLTVEGDSSRTLAPEIRDSLLRRLGVRFEKLTAWQETDSRSGGVVRISPIVHFTPDSVGVKVKYVHHMRCRNYMESDLSLLIVKRKGKWNLVKS
ncbi:MAG: hypothetical protein WKF55_07990 [Gemmatimonadaceae bacterium]